jgi:hypothetical protein
MQLTVFVSPDVVNDLRTLAFKDCRSLHQQARWMLEHAVKQAALAQKDVRNCVRSEGTESFRASPVAIAEPEVCDESLSQI